MEALCQGWIPITLRLYLVWTLMHAKRGNIPLCVCLKLLLLLRTTASICMTYSTIMVLEIPTHIAKQQSSPLISRCCQTRFSNHCLFIKCITICVNMGKILSDQNQLYYTSVFKTFVFLVTFMILILQIFCSFLTYTGTAEVWVTTMILFYSLLNYCGSLRIHQCIS